MYDVYWPKGRKGVVSAKAVIAARFENCTQSLERFCLTLSPHFSEARVKDLTDCHGQLVTWGQQTGAKDQTLDYKLRKAHDMHGMVLGLLTDLQATLQEGRQHHIVSTLRRLIKQRDTGVRDGQCAECHTHS